MRYLVALSLAILIGTSLAAQAPTRLRFDAATIKSAPELIGRAPNGVGLFARNYITLQNLLVYAYDLPSFRIAGGAGWVTSEHFDVLAKTDSRPTIPQIREMLQELLGDRFRLKVHREQRELPTFDLVMARSDRRPGPNLKPAPVDCTPVLNGLRPMADSPMVERAGASRPRCATMLSMGAGVITLFQNGAPLAKLTDHLERTLNRGVSDKTRLEGLFDVELSYTDDSIPAAFRGTNPPEAPSVSSAVVEQLGLKLESSRGPVDVLVIDSVERPLPD